MNKKQNVIIILLFLLMIFGIGISNFLIPVREFSDKENRALAQAPALSAKYYFSGQFAKDYESYITDQFIGRDRWIGLKTAVERTTFNQEINDIYFAEDGYLIEKHSDNFTGDTAVNNITYLAAFTKEMESLYGAGHVTAMVVPNAVDILKDKLPPFAAPDDESQYLKSISEVLPERSWFDSEAVLLEHSEEAIYFKTDHHWKPLGAYYVYEAWAKEKGYEPLAIEDYEIETVSEDFLGTIESKVGGKTELDSIQIFKPDQEYPYTLLYNRKEKRTDLYDWKVLDTKDKFSVFFGGNQPIIEASIENKSPRKLLVIKDSYAHCFIPFTFHDFSQVDFIDLRYYNESLKSFMESKDYTDILFLYNASGFAEDPNVAKLMN